MLRTLLILLAIPVILIVLAALLVPLLVDKDQLIATAAKALEDQTGATLTVEGETSLSVFPTLGVTLGDTTVTVPGELPQTLAVRSLEVGVQLLPLLSRKVEIGTLALDGLNAAILLPAASESEPPVDTSTLSNEELDAFYAARREALAQGAEINPQTAVLAAPLALNVSKLLITDARLELTDQASGEITRVEVISLTAGNINTEGEAMTLAANIRAPEAIEDATVELEVDTTLKLDLGSNQLKVEDLQLVVAGATPESLSLAASGEVDLAKLAADLQVEIGLGETRGSGRVAYASTASPQIDAQLEFNLLDPALLSLAGPDAAAAAEAAEPSADSDALPLDILRQIDTKLDLVITQARLGEYSADNLAISLRAVEGVVEISRLKGDALGGNFDLQATFNGKYNLATLASKGQVSGINLAQAVALAEVDAELTGSAGLDWDVTSQGQTISGLTESVKGTVELALNEASYNGQPVSLQSAGDVDLARQRADMNLTFGLAEMKGEGSVVYAGNQSPEIDARLHLNLLDPALLALAGPDAASEAEQPAEGADGDEELLPLAALREIDTRADLKVDKAILDAHTINDLHLEATAKDGLIKVTTLTGTLHQGKLNGGATLDARGDVARISSRGGLRGLAIPEVLTALDSDPIMSGKASLTWQINSRGNTTDALIANLRGPAKLTTSDAVLKDVGIEKMMCQAVALVNQQKLNAALSEDSVFKDLSMDIELGGGKARLKPLRADLQDITLRGNGVLDIQSENFKADFTAKLGAGLAELDPACKVNERYTAVDWPVACKGKVSGDPADWCGVDTGKIIEEMATYEAKRKLRKEAGKLLDGLLKR